GRRAGGGGAGRRRRARASSTLSMEERMSAEFMAESAGRIDRRRFMAYFAATGLGGTLFPGVLWALGQGEVTKEMIAHAEQIAGLTFTEEQREAMVRGLNRKLGAYEAMRSVEIPNSVMPALRFDPVVPGVRPPTAVKADRRPRRSDPGRVTRPANLEEVAFWPVT